MRGRRPPPTDGAVPLRLTPANAGTTSKSAATSVGTRAHPRECGDDDSRGRAKAEPRGSPPRMRGRLRHAHLLSAMPGLTPANAGTTRGRISGPTREPAHPRECGDDDRPSARPCIHQGSPPRMRGRQGRRSGRRIANWLTPANAGTTPGLYFPQLLDRAHPRECGDDRGCFVTRPVRYGSPPRMRGRPGDPRTLTIAHGLTPANAGTTRRSGRRPRAATAHPRECGDDSLRSVVGLAPRGSPPRMRGRRWCCG